MKKSVWQPLLNAAIYLVAFVLINIAATLLCNAILPQSKDGASAAVYGSMLCSVAVVAVFTWRRWSPPVATYLNTRPWDALPWVATAAVGMMTISDAIVGALGLRMPDAYIRLFAGIMNHKFGYIAIGILAPVAEEMVFRGGILRSLLRVTGDKKAWLAIFISALLFAIVHGNLAQGANALLLGLLLGWLFCRTNSVVPGIVLHWVNNTIAYILFKLMPGMEQMTLSDLCGNNTLMELFYIACALCVLLPSLRQLHLRLKRS